MSIHLFAHQIGHRDLEAFHVLLEEENLGIRCWINDPAQETDTLSWLGELSNVVVDLTAIATLYVLGQLSVLKNPTIKFFISQGTVEEIRRFERSLPGDRAQSSWLGRVGATYRMFEMSPDLAKARHESILEALAIVEGACVVVNGMALAAVDSQKRRLGYSIRLAEQSRWLLHVRETFRSGPMNITVEVVGKHDAALRRRVWTQVMLQFLLSDPSQRTVLATCGAKLFGWGTLLWLIPIFCGVRANLLGGTQQPGRCSESSRRSRTSLLILRFGFLL